MKLGKVCAIHDEFSPDGECRWCEPPPSEVPFTYLGMPASIVGGIFGLSGQMQQPLQQQQAQQGLGASPLNAMPPLPVASCKHDGALLDFSGTISCAACGKVLKAPAPLLCVRWQVPPCTNAVAWVWTATVHDAGMTFPACEEHHAEWLRQNASILHNWTREKAP